MEPMVPFPGRRPQLLLELDLTEPLVAPEADDPVARLRARGRRLLRPTLRALHEAAEDRHVVGLIAKVGGVWPWAAMQELRIGVQAFVASGKPALAWAESFGEGPARDMAGPDKQSSKSYRVRLRTMPDSLRRPRSCVPGNPRAIGMRTT